jgi:DNA-damage-inducible protein D
VLYELTSHLVLTKWRDPGEDPKLYLFGQLKRIAKQWLDGGCLVCKGGTYPAQLKYKMLADMACKRITDGITRAFSNERPVALFKRSTQAMKAQWKVPDNRPLADFAPTIILKAKDFATEITIFNAREHQMTSEPAISHEHVTNNEAVRRTLLERGIRPETLPAAEDVKKVQRRLTSEEKKALKNPESLDC